MTTNTVPTSTPRPATGGATLARLRPRKRVRELLPIYLFIAPGMIFFLVWTVYPLLDALVMSFAHWNLIGSSTFAGLDNYRHALADPVFWQSLRNSATYTVISVPGQMILGLAVAMLLDQSIRFRAFFRTLFYLPVVTSWVVVSVLFTYLYNGQAGALNYLLHDLLHIIPAYQFWLGDPNTALPSIAVLNIWKGIGWTAVIYLAGLQAIPTEVYDAAKVDGAGAWSRFTRVTVPLLRPTVSFLMVMLVIGAMNTFIQVFIMTNGGPMNSTESVLTYMYHNTFGTLDFGYGAAVSYLFTALMFVISAIQIRVLRKQYEY